MSDFLTVRVSPIGTHMSWEHAHPTRAEVTRAAECLLRQADLLMSGDWPKVHPPNCQCDPRPASVKTADLGPATPADSTRAVGHE